MSTMFIILLGIMAIAIGIYQLLGTRVFFELEKKEGQMNAPKVEYAEWSSILVSSIIIIVGICVLAYVGVTAY
ncbi:hypothetical protein [Companilactobacillus insicii]|uniref:hypothetical protein n=1 Tax=Companilactobacillus insicii TaxID=1732567 RepID=UPI000F77DD01|nr:hypothetical protein [Companilactobacillus insicii]